MQKSITVFKNSIRKKLWKLKMKYRISKSNSSKSWNMSSSYQRCSSKGHPKTLGVFWGECLVECHFCHDQWSFSFCPPRQIFFISEHNSLIKTFSQRSIIWLYTIIISLYHFYFATFCIWSLYFVYKKNNQPTDSCFCCTCR